MLAGLGAVDLVTPFDEATPLALIEALRPDVLIKDADYSIETVVGSDLGCCRMAARVKLAAARGRLFDHRRHRPHGENRA